MRTASLHHLEHLVILDAPNSTSALNVLGAHGKPRLQSDFLRLTFHSLNQFHNNHPPRCVLSPTPNFLLSTKIPPAQKLTSTSATISNIDTFHAFPKLAPELRLKVWYEALPGPAIVEIDFCRGIKQWYNVKESQTAPCSLLVACKDSRDTYLKHYVTLFKQYTTMPLIPRTGGWNLHGTCGPNFFLRDTPLQSPISVPWSTLSTSEQTPKKTSTFYRCTGIFAAGTMFSKDSVSRMRVPGAQTWLNIWRRTKSIAPLPFLRRV